MTILDTIKTQKLKEVQQLKQLYSISDFEEMPLFNSTTHSLKKVIESSVTGGIIAEFKRKSPAKGNINLQANAVEVTQGYVNAAVSGLSVLTDSFFFGADKEDFNLARKNNAIPMLRKDFIVDEYQIFQSKAMGADVVLLIAKILTQNEVIQFTESAHQLGMEVFLETQNEQEIIQYAAFDFDLIGINNRNLNSFEVNVENSIKLAQLLPNESIKIAESGIDSVATVKVLQQNGFQGFLMGEYFMKDKNPGQKCQDFINQLV
ncbi:indole-3-glycerol phosphate synthase TrpC [Flavobacterium sp.]|uniref:indole-3-glycerol phosphate synthase TrpC n=1 Tax=Flavobacterium sp. TaxID=239 RepID=UPI003F69F6A9